MFSSLQSGKMSGRKIRFIITSTLLSKALRVEEFNESELKINEHQSHGIN